MPPTSDMSNGNILKSLYFDFIYSNLISASENNLNPVEFGWNSVNSVLMPNKCIGTLPEMYTLTCDCKKKKKKKKNALKDISAASLAFDAQNFVSAVEKNVVLKFTNRLSWTLHKICKYKGFL